MIIHQTKLTSVHHDDLHQLIRGIEIGMLANRDDHDESDEMMLLMTGRDSYDVDE